MSYIPSARISGELANASVGVWLERLPNDRTALICKIPETAIKARLRGANASLLIGVVQTEPLRLLCLGMMVEDEAEHPLAIQKPAVAPEDVAILADVLSSGSTTIHCMNELNHPALSAGCRLEVG